MTYLLISRAIIAVIGTAIIIVVTMLEKDNENETDKV